MTSPAVLLIALGACFSTFTMSGMAIFLPLYLIESYGVPVGRAGVLTGVAFATTIVGQLSGGSIADRVASAVPGGRPTCVALGWAGAACAVATLAHAHGVAAVLACYAASQLLRGVTEPAVFGTVLDATEAEERGAAQGFLIALTFVGSSAAGVGVGALLRAYGFAATFHGLALGSGLAACFAAALAVRERRGSPVAAT